LGQSHSKTFGVPADIPLDVLSLGIKRK